MAGRKGTSLATRSRSAPTIVSPRSKTNVSLPFSRLTVQEPMRMTVGDWVSLGALMISVIGFSVAIWQSIRTANGPVAAQ